MLIPSHRHTQEDLRLWTELEAAYFEIGKHLEDKAAAAISRIKEFANKGRCKVCVSWGKDSTVVAHLSLKADIAAPLVWVRWKGFDNPDSERVRAAFQERFLQAQIKEVQAPPDDNDDGREGWAMSMKTFGERRIMGIRSDESAERKMSAKIHGIATERVCRPIVNWTVRQVMGYLVYHDLPIHPAYAMSGNGRWDERRLRVDCLGGERGSQFGRGEWEREYYGDVMRRLQKSQYPSSCLASASAGD